MPTFLIIDDDEIDRMIFQRVVEAEYPDVTCLLASSLASAEDIISRENVDMFVIDLSLTDGSGFDCVEMIRRKLNRQNLPIVLMSGAIRQKDKNRTLEMGLGTLLLKPMKTSENKSFAEKIYAVHALFKADSPAKSAIL